MTPAEQAEIRLAFAEMRAYLARKVCDAPPRTTRVRVTPRRPRPVRTVRRVRGVHRTRQRPARRAPADPPGPPAGVMIGGAA